MLKQLFESCCESIEVEYSERGHTLGWRFLTGSAMSFVRSPKFMLLTLNPAGKRDYPEHPRKAAPSGSAYVDESWHGLPRGEAPLQRQIRLMFEEIASQTGRPSGDALLREALSAQFIPFRAPSLSALPERERAQEFSRDLWRRVFSVVRPEVLLTIDQTTFGAVSSIFEEITGKRPAVKALSVGWGSCVARVQHFSGGPSICAFPHLSRFRIFGRSASRDPIQRILDELLQPKR